MTIKASIGYAQALNGREAGLQATHQALNKLGSGAPAFGFVVASHQYQAREVVGGGIWSSRRYTHDWVQQSGVSG